MFSKKALLVGAMAFLLQFGQVFGVFLGPNVIALADGRGLQILVMVIGQRWVPFGLSHDIVVENPLVVPPMKHAVPVLPVPVATV